MKKANQLLILFSLILLFSCTNSGKNITDKKVEVNREPLNEQPINNTAKGRGQKSILSGIRHSFSNDTICQTLNIKQISFDGKLKIPKKLEFEFILHDKQNSLKDKVFKGIAQLSSSEESFTDYSDKDGGDYFAADYNYDAPNYNLLIKIDIDKYEASKVIINAKRLEAVLGGYKLPNDAVMKVGDCK